MSQDKFVIGVDYGALSGRAAAVRISDGQELGTAVLNHAARKALGLDQRH